MSTQRVGLPERGAPPAMRALRSTWGRGPRGGALGGVRTVPERLGPTRRGLSTLQPRLSQPSQPLSPARHARCGEPPLDSAPGMRSAARPGQQAGPVGARIRMGNKWAHSARVPGRTRFRKARAGLRHPSSMQSQASSSAGSASGQAPPAVTWCVEGGMVRTAANRTRYPEARRSCEPDRPRGLAGAWMAPADGL